MPALLTSLRRQGGLLVLVVVMLAFACEPARQAAAQETEMPVLFDGRERLPRPDLSNLVRLRILTTADFPPFNFADQTGRIAGFNIDLAREICLELKIETRCQVQAMPFEELEKALANGNGDAVMAGVAVTAERRASFSFSRPYLMIPARFARNAERDLGPFGEDALGGRTVGVVNGSAHEAMLKAFFPRAIPVLFEDQAALLGALRENKVAAVFSDGLRLPFWIAGEASGNCCRLYGGPFFSERFLGEGLTVMLRQDDDTLREAIDHALAVLSRNGRLEDIYLRYFPHGLY